MPRFRPGRSCADRHSWRRCRHPLAEERAHAHPPHLRAHSGGALVHDADRLLCIPDALQVVGAAALAVPALPGALLECPEPTALVVPERTGVDARSSGLSSSAVAGRDSSVTRHREMLGRWARIFMGSPPSMRRRDQPSGVGRSIARNAQIGDSLV